MSQEVRACISLKELDEDKGGAANSKEYEEKKRERWGGSTGRWFASRTS
jgi:hypothetical protein